MKLTERDRQFIREEINRIVESIEKLTEEVKKNTKRCAKYPDGPGPY